MLGLEFFKGIFGLCWKKLKCTHDEQRRKKKLGAFIIFSLEPAILALAPRDVFQPQVRTFIMGLEEVNNGLQLQ